MSKLLVIAAWEPELARFRALGLQGLSSRLNLTPPLQIIAEAIGVGLVDATVEMTQCIVRHAPAKVLLLGTAGATQGSGLSIGDVVVARDARLIDVAIVEGHSATPQGEQRVTLDVAMRDAFVRAGARAASIANTVGITTDDALAKRLASCGEVEHLEAYGVARACALQPIPIPCAIVLGIANMVGAEGRDEWRANHVSASARAAEVAMQGIEQLVK